MRNFCVLIIIILLFSCREDDSLDKALSQAGKNKVEFFQVLKYYGSNPKDSLKLKAAKFLISNMLQHYTAINQPIKEMQKKMQQSDSIITSKFTLNVWWKNFGGETSLIQVLPDLESVNAEYLIDNIDASFEAWESSAWNNQVDFNDFCNYILPYRISDEMLAIGWRDSLKKQYAPLIDGIKDVRRAFVLIRDTIWKRTQIENPMMPYSVDVVTMQKQGIMTCIQGCVYLAAVARSLGIPVACDRIFQWANYSNLGHNWISLVYGGHTYTAIDGDSLAYEYNTTIDASIFNHLYELPLNYSLDASLKKRPSKIWRYTFKISEQLDIDEHASPFMTKYNNGHYEDVTDQYGFKNEIIIDVDKEVDDILLCIYYSGDDWLPIAYSPVKNGKAVFKNIGDSVVYQIMYPDANKLCPIGYPFIFSSNGKKDLIPRAKQKHEIVLTRKYPLTYSWINQWGRIIGSRFEVSNDSDFKNSIVCWQIDNMPVFKNEHILNLSQKYRYIRYVSAPNSAKPITELEFYHGDQLLKGRPFSDKSTDPERCFDGDTSTIIYNHKNGYSVGLDLGQPMQISRIVFFPKNDDNFIVPKHEYELLYYDKGWHSLGKQISSGYSLKYDVPVNALLLLKDRTKGKEERIFTYDEDRQIWW